MIGGAERDPGSSVSDRPGVLILVENSPVPRDRRVWQQACALREAGYPVSVVCPGEPGQAKRETLDGVALYRYPPRQHRGGPLGYVSEYAWAMLASLALALRVRRDHGVRIVQGCNPPDTFFALMMLLRLFGRLAYVFDQHDLAPELFRVRFPDRTGSWIVRALEWCERVSWRSADLVLCTNDTFRRRVLSRSRKLPDDVIVVRNGPDLERFRPVAPRSELKQGHRHLVVYVGTMARQDGLDLLLEAAAHVARGRGRSDVLFCLIGHGEEWTALQRRVQELGVAGQFVFPGWISDDARLCEWLCTADLCVAPDPANGMNEQCTLMKVAEYMAMGRPVVAFDLPETRVTAGEAALYAQPNDPRDFGDQILELLDDAERRERMGRLGRERAERSLSWSHGRAAYLGAFARLEDRCRFLRPVRRGGRP